MSGTAALLRGNAAPSELREGLEGLRSELAAAAQSVYDEWEQVDGVDELAGGGGICDQIADRFTEVIMDKLDVETELGGHDGDDHAWLIVNNGSEAFIVDIPPHVYERGSGYSWEKIPGVRFSPDDVLIEPLPIEWLEGGDA